MSGNKINGTGFRPVPVINDTTADAAAAASSEKAQGKNFKGALFQHGGAGNPMRRGPTSRMPLRSPRANRRGPGKAKARGVSTHDESDFESSSDEDGIDPSQAYQLQVNFGGNKDESGSDQSSDEGQRDEKRFQAMFQMSTLGQDDAQPGGTAPIAATAKRRQASTLPPMRTMHDIVKFIHASIQSNPSRSSLVLTLRKINAAVMRDEIKLPVVTKVAEARGLLIEIFGKGHHGSGATGEALRGIYAMLPLWLINLSKSRTAVGRLQAAARLSLPRIPARMD